MIEFLAKGGVLVTPILLCSVLALAIFLERLIRFFRLGRRGAGLAEKVAGLIDAGDADGAARVTQESDSPMARVLSAALAVRHQDRETLETVLVHATDEEVRDLSRYVQTLATIANIAPLLGLLGTVIGMILAFREVAGTPGAVQAGDLAQGIYLALVTTVEGLIVAIPSLAAFAVFRNRVDHLVADVAYATQHVFAPLKRHSTRSAARAAAPAQAPPKGPAPPPVGGGS